MSESEELARAIKKVIDQKVTKASRNTRTKTTGRVVRVNPDGTAVVDAGSGNTPVEKSAATVKVGDEVSVTIKGGKATIDGNLSNPSAGFHDVKAVSIEVEHVRGKQAEFEKVTAQELVAETARVDNLLAAKADISVLESDYITAANIEATYMHANMSNSDVAWISNGVIANGAISSAMINDVSANKLTAGTINGSVINVTNLTADNITAGTLNGQRIGAGSLSLDKLSEDVYTEAEVDAMLDTMQSEIDGAIETWTGTSVPTLNNAPASAWTTASDRDKHVGDVYFNTTSGYNYRFTKSGTGSSATYSWLQIKDTDITNALQRIQTAEGKITTFDSDISTLKTDTGELKTKTQSLETSLGDKVDTTTFNELSSTVEENSASITSMSTVLTNNGLTSSTNITNTVNTVSHTASGNSSKISQLTTTLGMNADGTSAANDVMHRMSDVEQDLDGITTRVSKTEAHIAGVFALSTTGASTTAKTATITPAVTGWTLEKGVSITVRFNNENTVAAPTLNVNSTGAKAIRDYAGNALAESAYKWKAGTAYSFTYNGTYWLLQDSLLTSRVTMAESTITQQAEQIEAKVSKDGVIAAINLSTEQSGGSAVKISADKVNIEGATIFTSGRLSQSSLDSAYDTAGSASAAQSAAISAAATDATSKANAAQAAATNAANAATDSKLESYSTTEQMNAALDVKVDNDDLESYRTEVSSTLDELGEGVDGKLAELASDLSSDMEGKLGEAEDRINEDLDSVRGDISDHAESIENLEGSISLLDTYVKIDPSVPSVTIAAGDSQTVITQSALQLLFQEMVAAYIAADADNGGASTLFATQLRVTGSMRFGNWEWYERSNGNMSVRWVGEES